MRKDEINEYIKGIDNYLYSIFEGKEDLLIEPIKYSLFAGGKRLRPLIMLLLSKEFNVDENEILPFCGSVEMIHTYSLIHDDLPALDNDDLRRGKPTNHVVFGEAFALLAGDALLNHAHESVLENINDKRGIDALFELSSTAGLYGMISGQTLDVYAENNSISNDDLLYIHKNKTGKLLSACFSIPAILKNMPKEDINNLRNIGMTYGLAFQVLDDILDVTSTEQMLGKPIGSDLKNNKKTFVSIYGLEYSKKEYDRLKNLCLENLLKYCDKSSIFYNFICYTFNRDY